MKLALDGSRQSGRAGMSYKWTALSNTTLGVLIATMNATSILIAMPVIFRGININPLDPSNFSFLLWLLMGYMLVSAILVVTAGRLGDMFGRVRIYNFGFAIFTASAIALSVVWSQGPAGALELIGLRMVQAVGGAMMMASSAAILTDAFPSEQLGFAMGINMIAALAGSFLGILAGGVLSEFSWRWVFIINVPVGLVGTTWGFWKLREIGIRTRGRIDWVGNLAFAAGLTALLVGITYGIVPYGSSSMGWGNPFVLGMSGAGIVILAVFVLLETRIKDPMFNLSLFKIRAFTAGNLAGLLGSIGRGGMQFMLIIWLQGIWLPLHGYAFTQTPLWAGIYMLPLTVGFLVAGPISGALSDRFGARGFATMGLLLVAATFLALLLIPVDFDYWQFALITGLNGIGSGLFGSPNRTAIMNSVPASERGSASGMAGAAQNAGSSLSIGVFFSLMIAGLSTSLPSTLTKGLLAHGVPSAAAVAVGQTPPVGSLFAAFLGYNPIQTLLGPTGVLARLNPADVATLTGKQFFPQLISGPFHDGLMTVFVAAAVMSIVGAAASFSRGKKYVHADEPVSVES